MRLRLFGSVCLFLGALLLAAPFRAQDAPATAAGAQSAGTHWGGQRGRGMAGGTVTSVGVDQFVVQRPDGSSLTVQVDDQTQFTDQGKAIQLEDLKVGDHVMVRVRVPEGGVQETGSAPAPTAIAAAQVRRVAPNAMTAFTGNRAFGEVTAINGNELTVRNQQGEKVIVISSDTVVRKDGQAASLPDLKVGDRVMAMGTESGGHFVATRVMSGQFRPRAGGDGAPPGPPPQP